MRIIFHLLLAVLVFGCRSSKKSGINLDILEENRPCFKSQEDLRLILNSAGYQDSTYAFITSALHDSFNKGCNGLWVVSISNPTIIRLGHGLLHKFLKYGDKLWIAELQNDSLNTAYFSEFKNLASKDFSSDALCLMEKSFMRGKVSTIQSWEDQGLLRKICEVYPQLEVLTFQSDACFNKADIKNKEIPRTWLNDSMYKQESLLYYCYDTFMRKSDGSFYSSWNEGWTQLYAIRNNKDSIVVLDTQHKTIMVVHDTLVIDNRESVFVLKQYRLWQGVNGRSEMECDLQFLYSSKEGIIGYRVNDGWAQRVDRLVKKEFLSVSGKREFTYYNFSIPYYWSFDPYD